MTELHALRSLLQAALGRLDALEREGMQTASQRRAAALRAAVAAVDPAGTCTSWQAACRIERALAGFDRRGDVRAGKREPRDDLEHALLGLHREEVAVGARQLHRLLTSMSEDDG